MSYSMKVATNDPSSRSISIRNEKHSFSICGTRPTWLHSTQLPFLNIGVWGIAPIFFSMFSSHAHLDSKLLLEAYRFSMLHCGRLDGQDGRVALNFSIVLQFFSFHNHFVFLCALSTQTCTTLWERIKSERGYIPRSSKVDINERHKYWILSWP